MARPVDRIWVRFGLWIAATLLLTTAVLAASVTLFSALEHRSFTQSLPATVRSELAALVDADLEDSPRAMAIYGRYWKHELMFGQTVSLLVGLAVCLPVGLVAGFIVSRTLTLPLASMAEVTQRIAGGDLSARALPGRDRGEMRDLVRRFNAMTDALEAFERERKATTAAISHELRTPLTILRARLHAACDGLVAADAGELQQWLAQAEHLGRLIDDLHTWSMADAGRLSLHCAPLDAVALARETLARHAPRLRQAGFEVGLLSDVASAFVQADADRMRQVMANLVENALRHAAAGRWLELGVRLEPATDAAPAQVVLSVSDAGPGLSDAARHQLFQRFAAGPSMPARAATRGAGSGLGLSIVHMLVTRQAGHVAAECSARGGTRFTIRLPMLAWPAQQAALV